MPPLPAVPGLPIPASPTDLLLPQLLGGPATAKPFPHRKVPQLPMLSANGTSSMHNDAYASDAYEVSGPLGVNLKVTTASYGVRECATMAFDSHGRIVGLCGGLEGFQLMVIDPVTLQPISELQTSQRDLTNGKNPFTDICGGTYFFLDRTTTPTRPPSTSRSGRSRCAPTARWPRNRRGRSPASYRRTTA